MPVERSPNLFVFHRNDYDKDSKGGNLREKAFFNLLQPDAAAPDIFPRATGFDIKNPDLNKLSVIDVVNNFEWTHTPSEGRHEVPFLRMSEYRVNFNSLIQNIRYLLTEFQPSNIDEYLKEVLPTDIKGAVTSGIQQIFKTAAGKNAKQIASKTLKTSTQMAENLTGIMGLKNTGSQKYLNPYYGLYGASPSGFEYYFPYFVQDWKTTQSNWSDWSEGGSALNNIVGKAFSKEGFIGEIESGVLLSPSVQGAYIERPKQYAYGNETPSVSFSIDLINTQSMDDIIRNWHLVFLLLYQNLPNKTSRVMLEPPVIYEVEVPGTFYSPYAYISNIQVQNRGATRLMKLPVLDKSQIERGDANFGVWNTETGRNGYATRFDGFGNDTAAAKALNQSHNGDALWRSNVFVNDINESDYNNTQFVETLIPDAFSIQITLKSLIPESKNFLFHSTLGANTLNTGIFASQATDEAMHPNTTASISQGMETFAKNVAKGIQKSREESAKIDARKAAKKNTQK